MAVGAEELRVRFTNHPVTEAKAAKMQRISDGCFELSMLIDQLCPDSREKSTALTNLDYVMSQAKAALARR